MRKLVIPIFMCLLLNGCASKEGDSAENNVVVNSESGKIAEDTSSSEEDNLNQVELEDIPQAIDDWKLVWNDEFNGNEVDLDHWSYDVPTNGRWNGEIQSYTDKNATVADGILVIEAREEDITEADGNIYNYSSSKMITKGKAIWTYGRMEIMAQMPEGHGIWPAIWMMPEDEQLYGTWPTCGEIDIMEMLGHKTEEIHGTIHYGEPHNQSQGTYEFDSGILFSDDFHEYAVEWEPGEIRWYIDDILYHVANDWYSYNSNNDEDFAYPAPFNQDFFLIMNISIGGAWPGNPDESTVFPQQMLVDYVRVYQKDDYQAKEKPAPPVYETRDPMEDGNFVYNPTFEGDTFEVEVSEGSHETVSEWTFLQGPDGKAVYRGESGSLHVDIEDGGTTDYSVQVVQTPMNLEKGDKYKASFEIMAESERDIKLKIGGDGDRGWADYAQVDPMTIGTEWESVEVEFIMNDKTDPKARFEFNMGLDASDVWIRNVRLEKLVP